MASRILTCVSCTLYFSFLVTFTIIGLTAIIIGFIGLGLYIPTFINYYTYNNNTCFILNHLYEICYEQNDISHKPCYSISWSVEYIIINSTFESYIFSTITQTYETPIDVLEKLQIYKDKTNHTCYYNNKNIIDVQWNELTSPKPYLIMMIVGFSLTGIYFIVIGIVTLYQYRKR